MKYINRPSTHEFSGFTLLELLVCLSLVAIVFFFALPFGASLHHKNQLETLIDSVSNGITIAKTQALARGETLVLSPLNDSTDWSQGMWLFVDNQQHTYRPGAKLLYEWHWQAEGVSMIWHGFQSDNYLLFTPDIARNTVNGYFLIKHGHQPPIKLVVNRLGRVKLKTLPAQ